MGVTTIEQKYGLSTNYGKELGTQLGSQGINYLSGLLGDQIGGQFGNIFSSGLSSAGNTVLNNIVKKQNLTQGLTSNMGETLAGSGVGLVANSIGQGINSLGGNSMLSRGIGQGIATGLGTLGGTIASNFFKGASLLSGFSPKADAAKAFMTTFAGTGGNATEATKAFNSAKLASKANLAGLGMSIVGSGLSAAFGPSKEYGGTYGNITKTMDTAYDLVQAGAGFVPGVGSAISGAMALNKGLSNIFGSTSGMTKQDAILGSAFMPAPVKWLNMAGARTTDKFNKQSWQNQEKADSFMGDAYGDLASNFERARKESGKTYGTFSRGAYHRAQDNIGFANDAWDQILAMANQNEYQNVRSEYMSSINNQRYAQMLNGGFKPLEVGRQGMKIFNNATNHNMGMRLLSAAALIDNKQMILCNVPD